MAHLRNFRSKAATAANAAVAAARARQADASAQARQTARRFQERVENVSIRTAVRRTFRRSLPIAVTLGTATGARFWRSYQRLEQGDLVWPDDSCVDSIEETLELAERSGLFPDGNFDLEAVRKWHLDHGYLGGVVARNLDESVDSDICYYIYYELMGCGQLEQQLFIRGTSNKADIAVDLEVSKVWDPEVECYFHAGFLRRAERVLTDVAPLLKQGATITLAGHSLGGAVATLIAIKLQKRGFNVRQVVSFGAPKLTNAEALDTFSNLPLLRVAHEDDIIVGLPPSSIYELLTASWKGVYHHVGNQLLLCSSSEEACFLGSETALQWWHHSPWFLFSTEMIGSHRLGSYVSRLQELRDGRSKMLPYNACSPRCQVSTSFDADAALRMSPHGQRQATRIPECLWRDKTVVSWRVNLTCQL